MNRRKLLQTLLGVGAASISGVAVAEPLVRRSGIRELTPNDIINMALKKIHRDQIAASGDLSESNLEDMWVEIAGNMRKTQESVINDVLSRWSPGA